LQNWLFMFKHCGLLCLYYSTSVARLRIEERRFNLFICDYLKSKVLLSVLVNYFIFSEKNNSCSIIKTTKQTIGENHCYYYKQLCESKSE